MSVRAQHALRLHVTSAGDATAIAEVEIWISTSADFEREKIHHFAITNSIGLADVQTTPGTNYIKFSRLGYTMRIDSLRGGEKSDLYVQLEPSIEYLEHAVVTVQYKKQAAAKAVERILVLDEKDLQSRSVVNLREALVQQMNIQIRNDNSTGSAMSMMGISGQNVKILIDGVPVIGRLDGNIDLSQINLNDVERIEVIEGPLSTNYGSNALAGVVNIITKKSAADSGNWWLDAYHESVGQDNISVGLSKKMMKTSLRINAGRNFFAGWTPGDSGRWDLWKPKEQYFGRLQINRKIGNVEVGIKSELFRELLLNKGKPLSPYLETAFDEHFYTLRLDQKISADWKVSDEASVSGFVAFNAYNRQRLKYFRNLVSLSEEGITHDGGSDTTGLLAIMSRATYSRIPKGRRLSYQLGYDMIVERGSGLRIREGEQTLSDIALFTTAEYAVTHHLSLKPGLRIAYNSAFKSPAVPMVSARWKRNNYTYRASYSQGFRAPDIKELFIEFVDVNHNVVGNTELEAERSKHVLLSVDGKRIQGKSILKPSMTAFYNSIDDKITLASFAPNQYTYVNISEFKSVGGNLRLSLVRESFRINAGISLTGVKTDLRGSDADYNFYNEWNASIGRTWEGYDFNVFAKFNGQQNIYTIDAENAAVTERFTGSYSLVDVQLGRYFFDERLRIQAGLKNVLNVQNVDNVLQSSGAHGSDAGYLAVANGRNYFAKIIYRPK